MRPQHRGGGHGKALLAMMKALETPTAIAAALFVLAAGFFMRRRNGAAAGHDKA